MIEHPRIVPEGSKHAAINALDTELKMTLDIEKERGEITKAGIRAEKLSFWEAFREYDQCFGSLATVGTFVLQGKRELKHAVASMRFAERLSILAQKEKAILRRSVTNKFIARMYIENLIPLDTLGILSYTDQYKPVLEAEAAMLRDRESNPN